MRRFRTTLFLLLGLFAQLAATWLPLASGLVVCVEQDGQVFLESSVQSGLCGGAASASTVAVGSQRVAELASRHGGDCHDVPLQLTSHVASQHQRLASEAGAVAAMHPAPAAWLPAWHSQPLAAVPSPRSLRVAVVRSTILRI